MEETWASELGLVQDGNRIAGGNEFSLRNKNFKLARIECFDLKDGIIGLQDSHDIANGNFLPGTYAPADNLKPLPEEGT